MRLSEEEYEALQAKMEAKKTVKNPPPKRSKYRNVPVCRGDIRFDSKAEAAYYDKLTAQREARIIRWFIRQPSFDLPGGVKYRADFLVVKDDGSVDIVDVKGFQTREFINKKKMVEALYGISLTLVK